MTELSPEQAPQGGWGTRMRNGALWMIALRWAIRLTGLVSTVILARLLMPSDFGIVAMAMIVVSTLEIFNQTGQKLVLIRLEDPTKEHFDTAWTVSFLIGLAIAAAILAASPLAEFYFHEPKVQPVMQCLALRAILGGLENIGTVHFRRDLKFNNFFAYNVYPKLISFTVTIALAFMLRNYWALVAGILIGQLALIVLSYIMHPHRPRFTLSKVGEIWSFSIWTFFRAVGYYLNGQVDQIAVGGFGGAALMGRYAVATDVAQSPGREINEPMVAVLYPVMSRLQRDPLTLRDVYLKTLGWTAFICASTGVGVALVAPDMQQLVLGDKWIGIAPLMRWLAIGGAIAGLSSGAYSLFDALNQPKIGARMIWIRLVMLAIVIAPVGYWTQSLTAIAICRAAGESLFLPGLFYAVHRGAGISFQQYVETLYRPFLASLIMAVAVIATNMLLPLSGNYRLAIDISLGGAVFLSSATCLWHAAGRPPTPEADLFNTITSIFQPSPRRG
ncbi:MAG TPA: lipopolysaccharide biosynthesis protein [Rhizomicrobium sp.]|nr:lipopolysaccharide biosynthesis protein [Rhizomicrobium sp.]